MVTRGSLWRKWDLHLHSKYSKESRTKMEIKEIFESAIKNEISMISITDHNNFDGLDEIWDIYENEGLGERKIKDLVEFLPGIELKTDKGKNGVHLIAIFPKIINIGGVHKKADKKTLYDNFCSKLNLNESMIESNGDNDYSKGLLASQVEFNKAIELTHELGGIIIVHGGDKHGSVEKEMQHTKGKEPTPEDLYNHLDITKTEIIANKIDVIELPNFNRREAKNAIFYKRCFEKPCMLASDSHEKADYDSITKYTWVKADCTFEGLRQALIDYDNRICLKDLPDELDRVKKNPTKYIDEVVIDWKDGYNGEKGIWFKEIYIPLNSGFISIIGNKGNGKSALAEIMAWVCDSRNYNNFAFLNDKKFLKNKLADNYICSLKWKDSEERISKNLASVPEMTNVERAQCIPQQYFEEICTDTELDKFTKEINSVIFSRLSEEEREGEDSLESLIEKYSKASENAIQYLHADLNDVNKEIINLEKKLQPSYSISQESLLKEAENQLEAHKKICPKEIKKPTLSLEIKNKYETLEKKIRELEKQINNVENIVFNDNIASNKLLLFLKTLDEFEKQINKEKNKLNTQLEEFDINIDDIVCLTINKNLIEEKKKVIDDELASKKEILDNEEKGLRAQLLKKQEEKEKIVAVEDKNIHAYDKYINEYQEWKKEKRKKEETIKKIQEELVYVKDNIMKDLDSLYKKRQRISKDICNEKKKIVSIYDRFKNPVDKFLQENDSLLNNYSINIRSGLVIEERLSVELFEFINKKRKNAFREDNYQLNKSVEDLCKIDDVDQYWEIPEIIVKFLKDYSIDVESQIKTNRLLDFYNYLYGMSYINNKYELISDDKTLDNLSPGERGALLLIFYLLLDLRDIPLIIDQPEDNLDNQSVTKILVPFIQEAKKRRQIILVTHNPNLAVVADSDQIIYVKIDKENGQKVSVVAGGIEDPEINESIVTILEGTMNSFRKRDKKYIVR